MKSFYLLLLLPLLLGSCQSGEKSTTPQKQEQAQTPVKKGEKLYPSINPAILTKLWDTASNVDIIFYNLDFSLSQNKLQDIRGMINTIGPTVPDINPACPAIGRIFFVVDGKNELEADLFFQDECHYYVFYENGKKKAANMMTNAGINFFTNVFNNVRSQMSTEQARRKNASQK